MSADFEVRGAEDFLKLSKALKAAGRTGKGSLRNELNSNIRKAVRPLVPEAQQALAAAVPNPVAGRANKTKHVIQIKTGRDPGVTIGVSYGTRGAGLGASNAQLLNREGKLRHPLWGDRKQWRDTNVPGAKGWFDETMRRGAPIVRPEIERAMERVIDKIVRDAK